MFFSHVVVRFGSVVAGKL